LRVGDGGRAFDRGYTGRRARHYPTRWGCGFAVEFDQPCIKPQLRRTEANTFLEELDWLLLRKAVEEPDEGGDQAEEKSKAIKREHKQLFFYLAEVNEKAHQYRNLWRIGSRNVKALFAAALFHRALTAYQALIFLIQKGFASEARVTCRNILEAKFKLAYLLKEPEAAVVLIALGEKKRADRLRNMKAGRLPVSEKLKGQDWDAVIKKAEEHLKDEKGVARKGLSMREIAKKCGLEENYLGYHSLFSEGPH